MKGSIDQNLSKTTWGSLIGRICPLYPQEQTTPYRKCKEQRGRKINIDKRAHLLRFDSMISLTLLFSGGPINKIYKKNTIDDNFSLRDVEYHFSLIEIKLMPNDMYFH